MVKERKANKFKKEKFIYQRQLKSGLWTFFVQIPYDNKIIRKNFCEDYYGSARVAYDAAVNYKYATLQEIRDNIFIDKSNITIREVLQENYKFEILTAETKRKHEMILDNIIDGNIKIQDLTREDIQLKLNSIVYKYNSDAIERVYSLYKRIIRTALGKGYIKNDICFGIIVPKSRKISKRRVKNVINRDIVNKFIYDLRNSKVKEYERLMIEYFVLCLYYTGCRPSEMSAIERNDIDFNKRLLYIDKEVGSDEENFETIRPTKNETSNRILPINDELAEIFKKVLNMHNNDIVFSDRRNVRYSINYFGQFLNHFCKDKDYKLTLYSLRHLFSTDLNNRGVDPRTHQELMGHANYHMSINYANSSFEQKMNAINNR